MVLLLGIRIRSVSYTHLDVYKRQVWGFPNGVTTFFAFKQPVRSSHVEEQHFFGMLYLSLLTKSYSYWIKKEGFHEILSRLQDSEYVKSANVSLNQTLKICSPLLRIIIEMCKYKSRIYKIINFYNWTQCFFFFTFYYKIRPHFKNQSWFDHYVKKYFLIFYSVCSCRTQVTRER